MAADVPPHCYYPHQQPISLLGRVTEAFSEDIGDPNEAAVSNRKPCFVIGTHGAVKMTSQTDDFTERAGGSGGELHSAVHEESNKSYLSESLL